MTTAREIMTRGVDYLKTTETVVDAARRLAQSDIGAVPVCEPDDHLAGVITDRDIVVKVIAEGKNPKDVKLGELADQPEVVTNGAADPAEVAIRVMQQHKVRRLPVLGGAEVIGVVSQGHVARCLPRGQAGELVAAISS